MLHLSIVLLISTVLSIGRCRRGSVNPSRRDSTDLDKNKVRSGSGISTTSTLNYPEQF